MQDLPTAQRSAATSRPEAPSGLQAKSPETTAALRVAGWPDYEYLDSGDGERLERFGPYIVRRPAPHAVWGRRAAATLWQKAQAVYVRQGEGGAWQVPRPLPESWPLRWHDVRAELRLSTSGQVGVFAEQQPNWTWLQRQLSGGSGSRPQVLNLFAYTGMATMAAAGAGAEVCHVDAVRSIVDWARANAQTSGLAAARIRWIVDDVVKFMKREVRRGRHYDAIILDPPTFGHGSQGQLFKIDDQIGSLLALCEQLLSTTPRFVLLTCHTPGYVAATLTNLLLPLRQARGGHVCSGDVLMTGAGADTPELPLGIYARWLPCDV